MTFGAVRSPSLVAMRSTESPCAVSRDRDSPPRPNLRSSQFDGRRQAIHPRQKHGATRVELSTSPVRCAITQHHANTRRQPTSIPPTTFLPRKNVRSWYGNRQTFPLQNYPLTCLEKQQEGPRGLPFSPPREHPYPPLLTVHKPCATACSQAVPLHPGSTDDSPPLTRPPLLTVHKPCGRCLRRLQVRVEPPVDQFPGRVRHGMRRTKTDKGVGSRCL